MVSARFSAQHKTGPHLAMATFNSIRNIGRCGHHQYTLCCCSLLNVPFLQYLTPTGPPPFHLGASPRSLLCITTIYTCTFCYRQGRICLHAFFSSNRCEYSFLSQVLGRSLSSVESLEPGWLSGDVRKANYLLPPETSNKNTSVCN